MQKEFEREIESIEQQLDAIVDVGSDDELFVASYLRGHFDLIACKLLAQTAPTLASLDQHLQQSLTHAFANGELEPEDQQKVTRLWSHLIRH